MRTGTLERIVDGKKCVARWESDGRNVTVNYDLKIKSTGLSPGVYPISTAELLFSEMLRDDPTCTKLEKV